VPVTSLASFRVALVEAQEREGPTLIDVRMSIEQIQAPKAMNFKDQHGNMRQASLVDLWPHLQQSEIDEALRVGAPEDQ